MLLLVLLSLASRSLVADEDDDDDQEELAYYITSTTRRRRRGERGLRTSSYPTLPVAEANHKHTHTGFAFFRRQSGKERQELPLSRWKILFPDPIGF